MLTEPTSVVLNTEKRESHVETNAHPSKVDLKLEPLLLDTGRPKTDHQSQWLYTNKPIAFTTVFTFHRDPCGIDA